LRRRMRKDRLRRVDEDDQRVRAMRRMRERRLMGRERRKNGRMKLRLSRRISVR
jgi:hypothetical protein